MKVASRVCILAAAAVIGACSPSNTPGTPSTTATSRPETPTDRANAALERSMPSIKMVNEPFDQAVNQLRKASGANIAVDWKALDGVGVKRATPVSLDQAGASLKKILSALFNAADPRGRLAYFVDEGVITVTTGEQIDAAKPQVTKVYDIQDLLPAPATVPSATTPADDIRQSEIRTFINTIEAAVAPGTWRDAGGKIGFIKEINGELVITQTAENQREVARVIDQIRQKHSPQRIAPDSPPRPSK